MQPVKVIPEIVRFSWLPITSMVLSVVPLIVSPENVIPVRTLFL